MRRGECNDPGIDRPAQHRQRVAWHRRPSSSCRAWSAVAAKLGHPFRRARGLERAGVRGRRETFHERARPVAIAAGVVDLVLVTTGSAMEEMAAQEGGSARDQVARQALVQRVGSVQLPKIVEIEPSHCVEARQRLNHRPHRKCDVGLLHQQRRNFVAHRSRAQPYGR